MSKYTTEVRFICENASGLTESTGNYNAVIANSRANIFDFSYPIFDEDYRSVLETKILKHYYTREIGFETVALWKLNLDRKLNEIMPFYNKMYEAQVNSIDDIFKDTDYYVKGDKSGTNTGTQKVVSDKDITTSNTGSNKHTGNDKKDSSGTTQSSGTGNSSSGEWNMYSDTPQGSIARIDVEANNYLTNATHDTKTGNTSNSASSSYSDTTTDTYNSTNSISNSGTETVDETVNRTDNFATTDDYLEHIYGKRGNKSYVELLKEYREYYMNIDLMIIDELSDLFLNLW